MPSIMTQCLEWDKALDKDGYGRGWGKDRKRYYVHRMAYESRYGKIPTGMQIDHLCKNRRCYNIEHLEAVTPAENVRRSSSAKLDYEKVETIKRMYATRSVTQHGLAILFGVGQDQISRIVNNLRWNMR